jgi:hypothetical protein
MSAPLDFLRIFAGQLRQAGIRFAITSGMACVHYGLQQNTKDSDWIIPADDLEKLRELLSKLEGELPPWRVSYRQIFGAPLDAEFMAHGWTSHLSIWDGAASVEHKVDIFSKPPRVKAEEMIADPDGWASQHVVAQMKKTDRDKDWPIVDGLGQRLWAVRLTTGLLHITHVDSLRDAWQSADESTRRTMSARRPLLRCLAANPATGRIERLLLLERLVWERVNDQRPASPPLPARLEGFLPALVEGEGMGVAGQRTVLDATSAGAEGRPRPPPSAQSAGGIVAGRTGRSGRPAPGRDGLPGK